MNLRHRFLCVHLLVLFVNTSEKSCILGTEGRHDDEGERGKGTGKMPPLAVFLPPKEVNEKKKKETQDQET